MSAGSPMRLSGTAFSTSATASSCVMPVASTIAWMPCRAMSVSTQPGQIAFTCTFSPASSAAKASGRGRAGPPSRRGSRCGWARRLGQGSKRHDRVARLRAGLDDGARRARSSRRRQVCRHELVEAVVGPVLVRTAETGIRDERMNRAALPAAVANAPSTGRGRGCRTSQPARRARAPRRARARRGRAATASRPRPRAARRSPCRSPCRRP